MKTEKKTYERPAMKEYELRQRAQLLAGSNKPQNYILEDQQDW